MTTDKLIITEGYEVTGVTINTNLGTKDVTIRGVASFTLAGGNTVKPALNDTEVSTIRIKDMQMQLENATPERKVVLEAKIAAAEACINAIAAAAQTYAQAEFALSNPQEV